MPTDADRDAVYATRPLVEVLCELAADADPRPIAVALATTAAADLVADPGGDGVPLADLEADARVFSDFYFPSAGESIERVFGVDLATPAGQTEGRFLSHPRGERGISVTDDLAARVLVAVPPWEPDDVRAFAPDGARLDLVFVAGDAPEETVG